MKTRRARLIAIASLIGSFAVIVPIVSAIQFARIQGRDQAEVVLNDLASNILRRAATLRVQTNTAFDTLLSTDTATRCSEADLQRLQHAAASQSYLQGLGRVEGNVLLCSTLTGNVPVDLGKAMRQYPLPGAPMAWDAVTFPGVSRARFAVLARSGYAAISLPELELDMALPRGVVLAQFAMEDRRVMRSNGRVQPDWIVAPHGRPASFLDASGNLVSVRLSDLGYTAALAALPPSGLRDYTGQALRHTLPIGIGVAALLLLAIAWRVRYLLSLKARLRDAIRYKEFFLLYQPVIDLRTGRGVGAEALIRWRPRGGEVISPVVFIPAAEQYGLIQDVTAEVINIVERDVVALLQANPDAHIAINFSATDLNSPQTGERLRELLSRAGARSSNIVIEATERGLMSPEKARGTLGAVRAQGFKVAIDDFGTGNSSLSYLATYELDLLKLDKMFVDSLEVTSPTTKIAFHIIEIAKTLGLEMVAEGVETERQRKILRASGVEYAQGWLFSKPISMVELIGFMHKRNAG